MPIVRRGHYLSAALIVGLSAPALADTLLVDRGLPANAANLNTTNYATRSDLAVGYGAPVIPDGTFFTGDDFTIAGAGQYRIDTVRTWAIAGAPGTGLNSLFTSVTLFGGKASGGITALETGSTTGSNPNLIIQPIQFANGQDYLTVNGSSLQLWQIDFTNLNWVVNGNELMQFGVNGDFTSSYLQTDSAASWFNLSTNAALAGSLQQGSDNHIRSFVTGGVWGSMYAGPDQFTADGRTFINSDVNVQVVGTPVPLPAAVWGGLMLLGSMGGYKGLKRLARKTQ